MAGPTGTFNTSALKARRGDLYDTHPVAVDALLQCETLPYRIWEPACGTGNIVTTLREAGHDVLATDLNPRGCPDSSAGVDFLLPGIEYPDRKGIVTNPPFSLDEEFVTVALERVPLVIMLLRLAFYEGGYGRGRTSKLRRQLLDGGNLARVHVFAKRLPMMHRSGWTGPRASSGMCFAWFVWDRNHNGPTTFDRITWTARPDMGTPQGMPDEYKMMGPEERKHAEIKALNLPRDDGPLFTVEDDNASQHRSEGSP